MTEPLLPAPTARLRFRRMSPDDVDRMAALLGDPAGMTWYPAPKTREQAADWIAWNERNYAAHGYGLWIVETHEGAFVGDCGLTWQPVGTDADGEPIRALEVGYHVRVALQGQGLASEAAAACRDLARDRVGVPRLVAVIHPGNVPSQRVAERIGLRLERDLDTADGVRRLYALDFAG